MYPPLCVQAAGGSRGRSTTAAGPVYYQYSQSAGAPNGKLQFLDGSTVDFMHHNVQSPKVSKQSKVVICSTSDLTNSPSSMCMVDKPPKEGESLYHEVQFDTSPGIFDIHAIDTELLSEDAAHDWSDPGSPYVPVAEPDYEEDTPIGSCRLYSPKRVQSYTSETFSRPITADKERSSTDSLPAKIKVLVRKRPINKKELARSEEDIICVEENGCCLTVHEPKLKVDLTAYVERHEFVFDGILDQDVTNEQVYLETVEPIIPTLFQRTKATCFAYGQTGSGKTYTMQPLPLKASEDILYLMQQPSYKTQGFQLWLSFFEIYGGKLFDLLNDRRKLCMREDGRQQVCIVGLEEFQILELDVLKEFIEKGSSARSTGSTGANEESSRSHAILQLSIKKSSDKNDKKGPQIVGKISFIDLAGSERGADTTDNDRQTRLEGAEINKSLLALKECIRALDSDQGHIPFRGSKLTEVLRDSFVGDSRTVMISCISPSSGSCEHTLNTLRYADRVKGLSRNSNSKKDLSGMLSSQQESCLHSYTQPGLDKVEDHASNQEEVAVRLSRPSTACAQLPCHNVDQYRSTALSDALLDFAKNEKTSNLLHSPSRNGIIEAKAEVYGQGDRASALRLPAWNGTIREAKTDARLTTLSRQDARGEERLVAGLQKPSLLSCSSHWNQEKGQATNRLTALLKEEDSLVSAHCKQLEQTIDFVREEMKLLSDIDNPGSQISEYVSQLSKVLSKKAAGLVNLQAHLARFQKLLKEQEILHTPTAPQPA